MYVAQTFEDQLGSVPLLAGAVTSAVEIASITGTSGPNLGFATRFTRV